jgi:hypothetical protein
MAVWQIGHDHPGEQIALPERFCLNSGLITWSGQPEYGLGYVTFADNSVSTADHFPVKISLRLDPAIGSSSTDETFK